MKIIDFEIIKKCGLCGLEYEQAPEYFQVMDECGALDGLYFNCECGSTLFVPKPYLKKELSLKVVRG